jgi:hypothetical protein
MLAIKPLLLGEDKALSDCLQFVADRAAEVIR